MKSLDHGFRNSKGIYGVNIAGIMGIRSNNHIVSNASGDLPKVRIWVPTPAYNAQKVDFQRNL